jgi:ribosome-binding factor A
MSQRTRKVASLVQQVVASSLVQELARPEVTVTGVDVSPDLRQATVWVGIIAPNPKSQQDLLKQIESVKGEVQAAVAHEMTTKFVPRLHFKLDTGGDYAEHISKLIRELE